MSYRDEDDPFEEDIVFDQAGLLSTSRKSSKSAIRRVSSGKCAMFSKTLGLCGAFLGLGLTFAIPGPLSPVPPGELSHDISLMTYEVMYRCQGFMIGAMFGARLLDRFNRLFLVFLALLVTALLVSIIPWCGHVWLLRTDMFLLGVSLGFLSTGGNVLCLDLWGRNSGPFMQALHFSFSLGIFLAPFLSQPLMAPINYALVAPSTTPAAFPLHRLPRDVGNLSSTGGTASSFHPTSHLYPDLPFNKSWTVANDSSASLTPSSTLPTKTGVQVDNHFSTVPGVFAPINSSMANATLSTAAAKVIPLLSTLAHSAASNTSLTGLLPLVSSQSTTTALPPTNTSSPLPAIISEAVGAPKVDVSTTTHRAPRPKPVLTNSEKLQDKKWENEKFRKPPPEDLVPVSTTMKPMTRSNNQTSNVSSSSPSPLSFNGSNSTPKPSAMINSTKSANVSELARILTESNSPVSTASSLLLSSGASINMTSNVTASALTFALPGSAVLKTNSSLQSNGTGTFGTITSSAMSPLGNASIQPGDATSTSAISPQKSAASSVPPMTLSSILTKATTGNYTTPKPWTEAPGKLFDLNANKQGGALVTNHTVVDKHLKEILNHSAELNNIRNTTAGRPSSSSAWSVGYEEESVSPSSAELSLPLLVNPKSSDIGKSISLDEQDLVQNGPEVAPTSSVLKPKVKQFDVPSSSSPPQVQLSTPQPQKNSKASELDKIPIVNQKSFGGGHVKAMMEAKPALVTADPASAPHLNKSSTKSPEKIQDGKVNVYFSPSNLSSPVIAKNSSGILENSSRIDVPASPKHIHHSKPASTVVNDTTEVTHTVIDAVANRLEKYGLSRMELMYLTVGMILLATSFLFLGFLCFNPRDPKSKTDDEDMNSHAVRGGHRSRTNSSGQTAVLPSRCMRHTLIGLMMMLLMITSGVQAMYGQLLLVYAIQDPLQLPQSTGSALTATFWGALTSTRFACILLASALSPTAMLVLSVAICSCATWLLSAFASSSEVALWIGSVMVSVGTASVFPSGMLWMQRHVLITHRVAAMLVMGPAMGEMFFPTLAYKMMVSLGPASLVHLPALLSLFAIAVWAAVWRLARYPRQPLCSHVDESSGYQLANQHDEDDLLDLTMSPIVNGTTAILRNHGRSNATVHGVHRMSA